MISDLRNKPHVHLDVVVSSKNEFTIIPDEAGIRRFWGIGHQPNIMSDADAMPQPQEVLALGDAKSFELKRALKDLPNERPIAWLFECEVVDALRTSGVIHSLLLAKADSAFKHLIESGLVRNQPRSTITRFRMMRTHMKVNMPCLGTIIGHSGIGPNHGHIMD